MGTLDMSCTAIPHVHRICGAEDPVAAEAAPGLASHLRPRAVAVEREGVGEVPRELDVLEGEQGEQHGVARTRCESRDDLVAVVWPGRPRGLVEPRCRRGRGPAPKDQKPRLQRFVWPMLVEELAPEVRRLERLMSAAEVRRLLGPVDREIDLADLVECLCGVLQPGRDLPVLGMGPDDRVDVMVKDR
jgi:hypothetical protein